MADHWAGVAAQEHEVPEAQKEAVDKNHVLASMILERLVHMALEAASRALLGKELFAIATGAGVNGGAADDDDNEGYDSDEWED